MSDFKPIAKLLPRQLVRNGIKHRQLGTDPILPDPNSEITTEC
jgi:hypothetical protein